MSAAEKTSTEKNNSNVNSPQKTEQRKWLADAFVIVFCVTGAAFSFNLFRLDLFQSIATQNKKPMGAVTVKYNNVQRRFSDRVLWSRLTVDSPVYLGDLIRVAEYSAATLNINEGIVDINENSLIRIRASSDGEDRVVIDLGSGSLSITGSDAVDSGVALNVMGRVIAPTAGATMSASAGESGMKLQVNEGSVIIKEKDGQSRSMEAGEALILNNEGVEQAAPAAVVMLPRPNARFIKNSVEPLNIRFTWNAINIDQQQPLRLEIAAGPNFTRIVQTAEGINLSNVSLGAGTWYWRLSYQDTVLSQGQFTITDADIRTTSPIKDNISYKEDTPIRFEWQPIEGASYYILEASLTPDMIYPSITRQTSIASYVESSMEAGNYYWRVKPVFPSTYEGTAAFSKVSPFLVEKIEETVIASPNDSISAAIFSGAEWFTYSDKSSKSSVGIAVESIDGIEREVLTINANLGSGTSKWAGAGTGDGTTNMDFIQKLKNANGVRFKVLGDGKRWRVYFATSNVTDGAFHGVTILTKNGVVSNIDIPFNKLNQPDWATRKTNFNKNNIKWLNIEINRDINNAKTSTIKVFDFEAYQNANDPSTLTPVPKSDIPVILPEPDTATPADSIANPSDFFSTAELSAYSDKSSKSNISIAGETINGMEREVLTINVTVAAVTSSVDVKWAGVDTKNIDVVQKLRNANGVRFKVLGDGKRWRICFQTSDVTDTAFYGVTISTKNGVVSNIDIPFNKLNQPGWATRPVRFNKNNINKLSFERNDKDTGTGASTIKIFDFEIYQTVNAPSTQTTAPKSDDPLPESDTATPADSIANPNVVAISSIEWFAYTDGSSKSSTSIAVERIDGIEKEVLILNANRTSGNNKWAGATTGEGASNINFIQKLRNANGVRFKVLGDGKKWFVYFAASNAEGAHHGIIISTKNGEVSNIDIPFSRLRQPDWAARKIGFKNSNIKWMNIEKNYDTGNVGESTIKIFDFEIY